MSLGLFGRSRYHKRRFLNGQSSRPNIPHHDLSTFTTSHHQWRFRRMKPPRRHRTAARENVFRSVRHGQTPHQRQSVGLQFPTPGCQRIGRCVVRCRGRHGNCTGRSGSSPASIVRRQHAIPVQWRPIQVRNVTFGRPFVTFVDFPTRQELSFVFGCITVVAFVPRRRGGGDLSHVINEQIGQQGCPQEPFDFFGRRVEKIGKWFRRDFLLDLFSGKYFGIMEDCFTVGR